MSASSPARAALVLSLIALMGPVNARAASPMPPADRHYYLPSPAASKIVHFYNTLDVLPHCAAGSPGEGVTCWPAPEVPRNLNPTCCDLGLTDQQEDDLVAFLRTLPDSYFAPKAAPASTP